MIANPPHGQEYTEHEDSPDVELKRLAGREENSWKKDMASIITTCHSNLLRTWFEGNEVTNATVDRNQLCIA